MKALLIFLISFNIFAEQAFIQACLDSGFSRQDLETLKAFAATSDHVNKSGSCIDIVTTSNKVDLFSRVLMMKFPSANIKTTQTEDTRKCNLTIEKNENMNNNDNVISANIVNERGRFNNIKTVSTSSSSSMMVISHGKSASFGYENLNINIKCFVTNKGYNLDFDIKGSNFSLVNSASLVKDQKIEVASIVQNAKSDNKALNINATSGISNLKLNKNLKVYIIAK